MLNYKIPSNLNGAELLDELIAVGVSVNGLPKIENDELWLDIANADKDKAASIVDSHNGTTIAAELTVAEKLASVGLSIEDLKTALLG